MKFETIVLPTEYSHIAPDGSEIRLLPTMIGGGLAHCKLPVDGVSEAVYHQTVEEIWYFIEGKGQIWRKQDELEEITDVYPGLSLTIPIATRFQFRNTGDIPLQFIIATMPPWTGPSEAVKAAEGKWKL